MPGPPSVALSPARRTRFVPASAVGRKLALPGLPLRSSVVSLVSGSNTPSSRLPAPRALNLRLRTVTAPSPSNTPAGSALNALVFRSRIVTPLRPAKSPGFSAAIPSLSSRTLVIPASAGASTSEQSITAASFACAAATSASRTCGVRSHTPPVGANSRPLTLCAASAATASWPRNAAVPSAPAMVPPASRMAFSGTAMPSSSVSAAVTV